ncbi:MAG: hypothetical protein ABW184_15875 [Sphingobium sp.]
MHIVGMHVMLRLIDQPGRSSVSSIWGIFITAGAAHPAPDWRPEAA